MLNFGRELCRGCITLCRSRRLYTEYQTVSDVISKMKNLVGARKHVDKIRLESLLPKSQQELPSRYMDDSFDTATIPLNKSVDCRNNYFSSTGDFCVSRLLEDMDIFSVWIAYKHIHTPISLDTISPYVIVTASISNINFIKCPKEECDIKISGHVTWVGKSSMEVVLFVYQIELNVKTLLCKAIFVLVARDPSNTKRALVNPLRYKSIEEKKKYTQAKVTKRDRSKNSLLVKPPTDIEKSIIHEQYIMTSNKYIMSSNRKLPPNYAWLEDTTLKKIVVCHPESRNIHGKLFGGFIMRMAYEVAFCNVSIFSHTSPILRHMKDVEFLKPVEIGSLLFFETKVAYTKDDWIMIETSAEVMNPNTGTNSLTNKFYFLFQAEGNVQQVMPLSYSDSMLHLDGRRQFLSYMESCDDNDQKALEMGIYS